MSDFMSDFYEAINHPKHYGSGADDPYEHIKVADAWGLNYRLGNATKYICRAGRKPGAETLQDLKKALWYLDSEIKRIEGKHSPSNKHYFEPVKVGGVETGKYRCSCGAEK
jgi:hypothetical protein